MGQTALHWPGVSGYLLTAVHDQLVHIMFYRLVTLGHSAIIASTVAHSPAMSVNYQFYFGPDTRGVDAAATDLFITSNSRSNERKSVLARSISSSRE